MSSSKSLYVGVKSVVVNQDKALILKGVDQNGKKFWDIPGGRINDNENINETLVRELKEEVLNIGENFKVGKLLNAYRLSRDLKDGHGLILLFYKVEINIVDIEISSEHSGYGWVGLDELDELEKDQDLYIESGYLLALRLALTD